jgi:hypothetical protein
MKDDIEKLSAFIDVYSHDDGELRAAMDRVANIVVDRDRLQGRVATLQKALDDHFSADKRAAKAIFTATGRKWGFPDTVEIVAFYVAEVERLEKDLQELRLQSAFNALVQINEPNVELAKKFLAVKADRDSLRAKLDRAKEALRDAATALEDSYPNEELNYSNYTHDDVCRIGGMMDECASASIAAAEIARAVLSELSADAPAKLAFITGEGREPVTRKLKSVTIFDPETKTSIHFESAPAQQTQISDEVREAMVEAEKALDRFATCSIAKEWDKPFYSDATGVPNCEGLTVGDFRSAIAVFAKLRSVMK